MQIAPKMNWTEQSYQLLECGSVPELCELPTATMRLGSRTFCELISLNTKTSQKYSQPASFQDGNLFSFMSTKTED